MQSSIRRHQHRSMSSGKGKCLRLYMCRVSRYLVYILWNDVLFSRRSRVCSCTTLGLPQAGTLLYLLWIDIVWFSLHPLQLAVCDELLPTDLWPRAWRSSYCTVQLSSTSSENEQFTRGLSSQSWEFRPPCSQPWTSAHFGGLYSSHFWRSHVQGATGMTPSHMTMDSFDPVCTISLYDAAVPEK